MTIEKLRPTFTFTEDRLRDLQAVVPEAFADGKINWEVLREALGEHLEDETQEHFGLTWPGKREARRLAALPPQGTLVPAPGEGVNEATTRNLFIEGENLEVLKLLQKSYAGRVKMIYIDPPYNTGSDFIYEDDFSEPLTTYLKRTGQMNDAGQLLTTNRKSSGRFHSMWLNMMYPRLLVARGLLRQDGAIFVSIDDNELHNLKGIMDEVFGEENFINVVSIKAKPSAGASGGGEDKRLKKNVEFLLVYAKDVDFGGDVLRFRDVYEETDLFEHINAMRDEDRSWKYTSVLLSRGERQFICSIRDGSGNEILVYEHKHFERSTINTLMRSGDPDIEFAERERQLYRTYFNDIFSDTNAQSSIRTRVIEALGEKDGLFSIDYTPISGRNRGKLTTVYYIGRQKRQVIWLADIAYRKGDRVILKDKISTLWDDLNWNNVAREGGISFPNGKKPIAFIQRMLELTTTGEDEELILDFFGGSGSTGHAVFNVNAKDNGNRRFIIVQLPVQAKEAHQFHQFGNIAELSKQRLRNAINESEKIIRGQRGFKVYRYQHSHFKKWQIIDNCSSQQLDYLLSQYESSVEAEWQVSGLCTEILLIEGFPLDSQQTQLEAVTTNTIWRVHHPDVGHELYICLDATLAPETLDMLKTGTLVQGDNIFICLDSALSDEAKVVLDDRLRLKVI